MQMQTNEIQATADSEPELCESEPTAAADMPTAAAARTDGPQCILHIGHCNRVSSLHARYARLFARVDTNCRLCSGSI